MKETWKFYKRTIHHGKERIYEVSNNGNVRINGILTELHQRGGYYYIGCVTVHRAVAELFIPNPEGKPMVDHINRDKHDNRVVNLRWVTNKENLNNSLTINHCKQIHKELPRIWKKEERKNLSNQNKKRKHMSNGIDRVFPLPDKFNYYLKNGYHFGSK